MVLKKVDPPLPHILDKILRLNKRHFPSKHTQYHSNAKSEQDI